MKHKLASADFEWEVLDCDNLSEYNKLLKPGCNLDTIGYFKATKSGVNNKLYRRKCLRNADGTVALNDKGQPQWVHETGIDGRATILRKVELVRTYLKENFNIDLDALRKMVQERTYVTNPDGTFVLDSRGRMVNKLTSVQSSGSTLIDELREQVERFKALQSNN